MPHQISALARVPGFRAIGVACGLKESKQPDLALVLAERACPTAAVFTKNAFKAAPVLFDIELLKKNSDLQAIVVNAGNANAVTGTQGLHDAEQMAQLVEKVCDLPERSVFVMSTGVIGYPMPMDKIAQGIAHAAQAISTEAGAQGHQVAQAIMTTDLVPKESFKQVEIGDRLVSIGAMAKGSGMIHPNMGTMLSAVVTDAALEPEMLQTALQQVVARTFNRVTVDGDTSTNDTVVMMASGLAGNVSFSPAQLNLFVDALTVVCTDLAKAIARDGEGATKLLEITVQGAATETEAESAAKVIATSPLVKTAFFGNDPNWGRVVMALGRSNAIIDPQQVSLQLGDFQLVSAGEPLLFDSEVCSQWLADNDEVTLTVDLGVGEAQATVWTCDFSYKYVEINAEYHT